MQYFALLILLFIPKSFAFTFNRAIKAIDEHPKINALLGEANSLKEEGASLGSWGDPVIGVKARNLPKDNLVLDESPMSGVEYSISQNLALTTKYSKVENSYALLAEAKRLSTLKEKKGLHALLWKFAISKRRAIKAQRILKENLSFLENMLNVTNRLYANGKVAQQAVLEIQIRKSELEALLSNNRHDLEKIEEGLKYLFKGLKGELELSSAPWELLERPLKAEIRPDEKELGLNKVVEASELNLSAQKLAYVPDVQLSLSYIDRDSSVDGLGDFVSAGVFFSLPLSSKKYAKKKEAVAKRYKAQSELNHYQMGRHGQLGELKSEVSKLREELDIVREKTVSFAKASRQTTAKSYELGKATYVELTQAELKLQNILLREIDLEAELAAKKVQYLYLSGEPLHEI